MKKILKLCVVVAVTAIFISACASPNYISQSPQSMPTDISYQTFYDNLSPYGTWIDYPGYGHVWNPRMEAGFRPYATNGRWAYSNEGWAWQSNYSWGWAPFHYGSWLYDDMYGWLWKPGYEWSPAWVTWGTAGNNYAWAPLMPEVNIGVQFENYRQHPYYWNVCGRDHIYDRNISNVIVHNTNITNNITIINNYNRNVSNNYYAKGPDVNEVQRYTRDKIEPVTFRDINQIKQVRQTGNVLQVYRPTVQNSLNSRAGLIENSTHTNINNQNNHADTRENNINRNHPVPVQNQQPAQTHQIENTQIFKTPNRGSAQPVTNDNRTPNANQAQDVHPRQFRRAETEQIKPVGNNSEMPVNQPKQQRQNVQQLPFQRNDHMNNNSNRNSGKRDSDNRRN